MQTGTIAFLAGILLLQQQAVLPSWSWLFAMALVPLLLFRLHRRLALGLGWLLAGFVWASVVAQHQLSDTLPKTLAEKEVEIVGQVVSLPERTSHRSRFVFEIEQLRLQGVFWSHPARIRLNWYQDAPQLLPGQRWRLTVRLKRPHSMINPGGFDYERWLFQQGIRATGYVRPSGDNALLSNAPLDAPLQRLRHSLQQQLRLALPQSEFGGIVRALAIGDRSDISDAQWQLLLTTGTNHLMAISGLHIGLVAGLVYLLVLRLWCLWPAATLHLAAPRAAALLALLAALVYAALAGFSLPTQRALLMLMLVMGAIFLMRPVQPLRVLSLALLLLVIYDPLSVLSPGFWLSFAAVALILFGMGGRLNPGGMWWRWGRVQWLVALGLAPLLLLLFGQAALVAPLANLIAVPLVGMLVVPFTLLASLLLPLWQEGGAALLFLATGLLELLWPLLAFLAEILPALQRPSAPAGLYWLTLPGVLWLLAPRGWPLRWAGTVLLLPLLLWQPAPLKQGEARFTLLDVGQGLAAVVETRHHVLVFDTGARFPSGFNTGTSVVLPFLRQGGWRKIDTLIISHGDNDHIGGARAVAERMPVGRVLTSVPKKMDWISHEHCRRGEQWHWDGVGFALLHPERLIGEGRGNNDSCVLQLKAAGKTVLLTGDIEQEAERELLSLYGTSLRSDILLAPHHGSKSSSDEGFLHAVRPRWVLFPLGFGNRYGFPHAEVVERYRQQGVVMLDSAGSGAISFLLNNDVLLPREQRRVAQRYWHNIVTD